MMTTTWWSMRRLQGRRWFRDLVPTPASSSIPGPSPTASTTTRTMPTNRTWRPCWKTCLWKRWVETDGCSCRSQCLGFKTCCHPTCSRRNSSTTTSSRGFSTRRAKKEVERRPRSCSNPWSTWRSVEITTLRRLLMKDDSIWIYRYLFFIEGLQQHQPIGKGRTLLRHEIRLFREKRPARRGGRGGVTRLVLDRERQRQSDPSGRIYRNPELRPIVSCFDGRADICGNRWPIGLLIWRFGICTNKEVTHQDGQVRTNEVNCQFVCVLKDDFHAIFDKVIPTDCFADRECCYYDAADETNYRNRCFRRAIINREHVWRPLMLNDFVTFTPF